MISRAKTITEQNYEEKERYYIRLMKNVRSFYKLISNKRE